MSGMVDIAVDPRFSLDENWRCVEEAIADAAEYGVAVTPTTVLNEQKWIVTGKHPYYFS